MTLFAVKKKTHQNRNSIWNTYFVKPYGAVLDFLIPPTCLQCYTTTQNYGLCGDCFVRISGVTKPFCKMCSYPLQDKSLGVVCGGCIKYKPNFILRFAVHYNDASKRLILDFKHGDKTQNADFMGREMARVAHPYMDMVDCIIPVPLHYNRMVKRRYNQSALLAYSIRKIYKKPVLTNILKRHKNTKMQRHKTYSQRYGNLKKAFSVPCKKSIEGRTILLVDDVYTTGATVKSCTEALYGAGAKRVIVVTYARVVRPQDVTKKQ